MLVMSGEGISGASLKDRSSWRGAALETAWRQMFNSANHYANAAFSSFFYYLERTVTEITKSDIGQHIGYCMQG